MNNYEAIVDGVCKFLEETYNVSCNYSIEELDEQYDCKYLVLFENAGWSIRNSQQVLLEIYSFAKAYGSMNNCEDKVKDLAFYIKPN